MKLLRDLFKGIRNRRQNQPATTFVEAPIQFVANKPEGEFFHKEPAQKGTRRSVYMNEGGGVNRQQLNLKYKSKRRKANRLARRQRVLNAHNKRRAA